MQPDFQKEFLDALESYVTARIEMQAAFGSTVPYAVMDRWKNSKLNLSLTLANLIEGRTCITQ